MKYRKDEKIKMEKKRGKGRPKGIPKSPNSGRQLGSGEKTERFLTHRVTPDDKKKLDCIFDKYQKKYNLKKNDAIKKIFFTIADLENISFEED